MVQWNAGVSSNCVLCGHHLKSRNHFFFTCHYSGQVLFQVAQGLLRQTFASYWDSIVHLISDPSRPRIEFFFLRYVFQTSLYHVWREWNSRRQGVILSTPQQLIKLIDKAVRKMISSICMEDGRYDDCLSSGQAHDLKLSWVSR